MNVYDDLEIAQNIMEGSIHNFGNSYYGDSSCIYKVSNEKISSIPYVESIKDRDDVLSVIASGDQILNSILYNCKNIDGYDISRFPKYFLLLKIAGILSLNREEFIKFFISSDNYKDVFNEEVYLKLRDNLDSNSLVFWDGLFDYYDGHEIYNSTLFSSQPYSKKMQVQNNPYLDEKNFNILKSKIGDARINFLEGNIFYLISNLSKKYDLINLSSIIYYLRDTYKESPLLEYLKFLDRLPLKEEGVAITYLYDVLKECKFMVDFFANNNIYTEEFIFDESRSDGILRYKKRR